VSSGEEMRRIVIEIVLILFVALFLSLTYNAVSPSGIRILPKKMEVRKDVHSRLLPGMMEGSVTNRSVIARSPMLTKR